MNFMNFGREQLESGSLDGMLQQVGIDDVSGFVNQFRNKVNEEAGSQGSASADQQPDLMSMGSSFLNQLSGGGNKEQSGGSDDLINGAMNAFGMFSSGQSNSGDQGSGGGGAGNMINSAMKVYKMLSGSQGGSGSGGGNIFDTIGTAYEGAQQVQTLLKKLDRNGDGKITLEDIQLLLEGLGLGSVSPTISKGLFKAVDRNGNGELDLSDAMALAAIVSKLKNKFGSNMNQ